MDTVTLTLNGVVTTMSLDAFSKKLTANACVGTSCASDVASAAALDNLWLVFGGVMVFFMLLGFGLLEIGCCSVKNTKHILFRNLSDLCLTGLTFYAVGYAFLFGDGNDFIGHRGFFLQGDTFHTDAPASYKGLEYGNWFFQWAIAAVAVTIFSGAVAERITFGAYLLYTLCVSAVIYPVAGHWIWSTTGWASVLRAPDDRLFEVGTIDFAGCGCIHMLGGISALIGCIFLGPRKGRFHSDGTHAELPKQSVLYQSMGTLILWFGWYGFNCVSTLSLRGDLSHVMTKVAVNLTLGACMGGVCTVLLDRLIGSKTWDVCMANNGILAGCVSVTGSCSVIEPEGAVALGAIASLVYVGVAKLVLRCKIDDVVDAVPVHFGCGTLGALAPGFFASGKGVAMAVGSGSCGVLATSSRRRSCTCLRFFAWVAGFCTLLFGLLSKLGLLRVSADAEAMGLDAFEHGGAASTLEPAPTPRVLDAGMRKTSLDSDAPTTS
ncbi:hypothetical protein SPRG_09194 [Saprolegnia parasitica CBS 223.65]|uniref:Ammonium transporter n=1 Tax=Saprolegnia parasitica (strain CBS 223.65) TaxID=695850 RepID=A0A067CES4_SAPPC|nr:hypothetical protein SPRG_09194 [Saprolegnia parasitica CBS 223.65]KDO25056.1 hypothetical protein SPRG_09194 [Saprolegnia parasitica CBS 223.65]|eukprot:XP_012204131.1 hypothetical protein SPRG_09194 [Saprolegnia parasitica CBS 223.65]